MKTTIPDTIHEQASLWVFRLHAEDCTAIECGEFQRWLAKAPTHLQAYQKAESLWQSFSHAHGQPHPHIELARSQLRQAQRQRYRQQTRSRRLAVAASLLLAIGSAPFGWDWLNTETYTTAKGQRAEITLNDGSRIELNTDSQMRVNYAWQARQVTLERGEALFSVAHDPGKPFVVIAALGRIRDIGTHFNVRQWHGDTTVSVLEGEVAVSTETSPTAQNLLPGQQLQYDSHGGLSALAEFDNKAVTAWRDGLLVFNNTALSEALEQLSRYHAIELKIADPKLGGLKVSGNFPSNDLGRALEVITTALPVKVIRKTPTLIVLGR